MTKTNTDIILEEVLEEIKQNGAIKLDENKIQDKISFLSDNDIISGIGMADMPLIVFLLTIKYNENPNLIPIENDIMIRIGQCNVANMSYLAVYLHFLRFENGILEIEGNVSYPSLLEKCEFQIKANNNILPVEMTDMGLDLRLGENVYEKRTAFKAGFELSADTEIHFYNIVNDLEAEYGRINSMRFAPVADCIPYQFYEKDGWIFYIEGNHINCRKVDEAGIYEREVLFRNQIKKDYPDKSDWIVQLREYYYSKRKKDKQIWVFMDRTDRADDNAEVLFEYVQKNCDVDSYFIISENSNDYKRIEKIGKVVPLYSQKHFELAISADCVISSQCNGVVENPFWQDSEFFRDLYHRPKMIFLQHGVIKDDMSPTLNRFNTNLAGFVTSTKREYESLLEYPYHYTSKEVWLTGLPRYDKLINDSKKVILIMPTWRMELMEQVWDEEKRMYIWALKKGFEESDFLNYYKRLILNKKINRKCKKFGYRLCFMAHPLMRDYLKELITEENAVEIWDNKTYREAFAEGMLLITDYSSVAFDFSYLRKPVIYYQFDKEEFFLNHTYHKGYFDYEKDGFGEVCRQEKQLIKVLVEYIRNGCTLKKNYRERMDNTWIFEGNYCERVVDRIKEAL